MRIYRVIDNAQCVLTTSDELTALRLWRAKMESHDKDGSLDWGWIEETNV